MAKQFSLNTLQLRLSGWTNYLKRKFEIRQKLSQRLTATQLLCIKVWNSAFVSFETNIVKWNAFKGHILLFYFKISSVGKCHWYVIALTVSWSISIQSHFQISNVQILLNVILILKAETFTQFQLMIWLMTNQRANPCLKVIKKNLSSSSFHFLSIIEVTAWEIFIYAC